MNDPTDFTYMATKLADPTWRATNPLDVIQFIRHMKTAMQLAQVDAVRDARTDGRTWDEIGEAMGTSRQGAFNYGHHWANKRLPLES